MINLIIPDIHNKVAIADKILKDHPHDHAWFLGDYFDDFHDSDNEAYAVAAWVRGKLQDPKVSLLLGNHDYHYWKQHLQKCAGFTHEKCRAIRSVLSEVDFEKMLTHAWVDGWLLSHAGYSRWYTHPIYGLTPEVTAGWDKKAKVDHYNNKLPEIFWAGQDRGGNNHHSGVIWQDWWHACKIEGVNQIVGHTPNRKWRESHGDYCLDTGLHCVGILEDGKLEVVDL